MTNLWAEWAVDSLSGSGVEQESWPTSASSREKKKKEKKRPGKENRDVLQSISSLLCAYTIMYVTIQSFMARFCVTMKISFLAFPLFVEKRKTQQLLTWSAASTGMDWKCWVYCRGLATEMYEEMTVGRAHTHTRTTHANRRWFSKNRSQKEDRCLMRRTLVLSVRGKWRSLADSLCSASLAWTCSSIKADKLWCISGWNFVLPGEDIFPFQIVLLLYFLSITKNSVQSKLTQSSTNEQRRWQKETKNKRPRIWRWVTFGFFLRHWYHTRKLSVTKDGGVGREWLSRNHEPLKASSQGVFNLVAK